jgi:hypothetical protein
MRVLERPFSILYKVDIDADLKSDGQYFFILSRSFEIMILNFALQCF